MYDTRSLDKDIRESNYDHAERLIDQSLQNDVSAEALATLAVARALLSIDAKLDRIADLLEESASVERIADVLEALETSP